MDTRCLFALLICIIFTLCEGSTKATVRLFFSSLSRNNREYFQLKLNGTGFHIENFKWSASCTNSKNALGTIDAIALQPDPINIPGEVSLHFAGNLNRAIKSPTPVSSNAWWDRQMKRTSESVERKDERPGEGKWIELMNRQLMTGVTASPADLQEGSFPVGESAVPITWLTGLVWLWRFLWQVANPARLERRVSWSVQEERHPLPVSIRSEVLQSASISSWQHSRPLKHSQVAWEGRLQSESLVIGAWQWIWPVFRIEFKSQTSLSSRIGLSQMDFPRICEISTQHTELTVPWSLNPEA